MKSLKIRYAMAFLLIQAVIISIFGNIIYAYCYSEIDGSIATVNTVGTTMQDSIFIDKFGYMHCFFADDSTNRGLHYRTSDDNGTTWDIRVTMFNDGTRDNRQWYFDIEYNETMNTCYFVRSNGADGDVYLKLGEPQSDGTITWNGSWNTVYTGVVSIAYVCMKIDFDGYPYILIPIYESAKYQIHGIQGLNTQGSSWDSIEHVQVDVSATWLPISLNVISGGDLQLLYSKHYADPRETYLKNNTGGSWGTGELLYADSDEYYNNHVGHIRGRDDFVIVYSERYVFDVRYAYFDGFYLSSVTELVTTTWNLEYVQGANDGVSNTSYFMMEDILGDDLYRMNFTFTNTSMSAITLVRASTGMGWLGGNVDVNTIGNTIFGFPYYENGDLDFVYIQYMPPPVIGWLFVTNLAISDTFQGAYVNITCDINSSSYNVEYWTTNNFTGVWLNSSKYDCTLLGNWNTSDWITQLEDTLVGYEMHGSIIGVYNHTGINYFNVTSLSIGGTGGLNTLIIFIVVMGFILIVGVRGKYR